MGDAIYYKLIAKNAKYTEIKWDKKSTPEEVTKAENKLAYNARYNATEHVIKVKTYSIYWNTSTSEHAIYAGGTIVWYGAKFARSARFISVANAPNPRTCVPEITRRTYTAYLGDYYYFGRNDKKLGLESWKSSTYILSSILVKQYGGNLTTKALNKLSVRYANMTFNQNDAPSAFFHWANLYRAMGNIDYYKMYARAAELGNVFAAYEWGNISPNIVAKTNWYTFAATGGLTKAAYALGELYRTRNMPILAQAWFVRASLHSVDGSQEMRDADNQVKLLRRGRTHRSKNVVVVLQTTDDDNYALSRKCSVEVERHIETFIDQFDFEHLYIQNRDLNALTICLAHICKGQRKIAHLIIMAHGTATALYLSPKIVSTIDTVHELAACIRPYLASNSSVFLESCSTGLGGRGGRNVAQALANSLRDHAVWGISGDTCINHLVITNCKPDATGTYLDIVYGNTGAVQLVNFVAEPFHATLDLTVSLDDTSELLLLVVSTRSDGIIQLGSDTVTLCADMPQHTRNSNIILTKRRSSRGGEWLVSIRTLASDAKTPLIISGTIQIIRTGIVFRRCLISVENCGHVLLLPEQFFADCMNLTRVPDIVHGYMLPSNLSSFFANCATLEAAPNYWDTKHVTNMTKMFQGCSMLNCEYMNLDTGKVTSMEDMFNGCRKLKTLGGLLLDTSRVTAMTRMFRGCVNFTGHPTMSRWDVSHVQSMHAMFSGCKAFNIPLYQWNVSCARYVGEMFVDCTSFDQNINTWNVSAAQNMADMFRGCVSSIQTRWSQHPPP